MEFEILIGSILFALIVGMGSVFLAFLWTAFRVTRLIRPEHRQLDPASVFLCLIPFAGYPVAVWMVQALAISLRKQFEALGEPDSADSYGLDAGQTWPAGILGIGFFLTFGCLSKLHTMTVFMIGVFIVAGFNGWVNYWRQLGKYKARLKKHFDNLPFTQDELDYADDIQEGRSDEEDRW